jgi:ABC-type Na+ efflux pump permease subunit
MRKTLVIAVREYLAAVRTKTFIIGLLIMPLMMGGSILVQALFKNVRDTTDKHFAVIDRSGGELYTGIEMAVKLYNEKAIYERGKQVKPRFVVSKEEPRGNTPKAIEEQRLELSERVRKGELFGFLDIGPKVLTAPPPDKSDKEDREDKSEASVRYQSNRPTFMDFSALAGQVITEMVRAKRLQDKGIKQDLPEIEKLMTPVPVDSRGLTTRDPRTGEIKDAGEGSRIAPVLVPIILLLLMFMVIMMGATPLMQGVVEEKMQRIAEVLLGSVSPFQLMMGKLLGGVAVSLTIVAVYLGGAAWAAHHYHFAEYLPASLVFWFLLFEILSSLMYGSLFIAIGAACSDMRETQNLLLPVMLLACLPMFMLGTVLQEPNGPAVVGVSFFPFATPMLMTARMAIPPGAPLWQPLVGVLVVLATTVACVYAAGRIFRVGILMQGKGARLADLVRWVIRG